MDRAPPVRGGARINATDILSNQILQVREPLRTFRLNYRVMPDEDGVFELPSVFDLNFIRFDKVAIYTDFRRRQFGALHIPAEDNIFDDHTWSWNDVRRQIQYLSNVGVLDTGIRPNSDPLHPIWDFGELRPGVAADYPFLFARTEFYNELGLGGNVYIAADDQELNIPTDVKMFGLDCVRPTCRWYTYNSI